MTFAAILAALIKILIIVGVAFNLAAVLTWAERRQSAMMQDRFGPNRASFKLFGKEFRLAGLVHVAADGVKFFFKEDFVPPNADKVLHALAPMLSLFPPIVLMAVVPFGDVLCIDQLKGGNTWAVVERFGTCTGPATAKALPAIPMQVFDTNMGILYIFALAGMGIVGATIAGWSSDNKFSILGGLRAASQLVSYEVAMGLSLVGAMMVYGTLRLDEMARWQGEHVWGIFVQPLGFLLFWAASLAESKRTPFDMPEGESEIVAGHLVEYSGMKFGMFYFGEYIEIVVSSALLVAIFLGGYNMPFLHRDGITVAFGDAVWHKSLPHLIVILIQVASFFGKVTLMCWFQLFFRWTLPRFRYDQVMKVGWRMLLPACLVNVFLTGVVVLAVERAGEGLAEKLNLVADGLNILVALLIVGAVLRVIVGFFSDEERTSPPPKVTEEASAA
jgi:NADH-quinone oxidoreductase subunit H